MDALDANRYFVATKADKTGAGGLEGLRAVAQRTVGQHAVLRAAALSFGLVYIHPLADGNGRISRFLSRYDQAAQALKLMICKIYSLLTF